MTTDHPKAAPGSFSHRLKHLLGDRAVAPWMRRMRVPDGTKSRMLKGEGIPPTYETLARLMRVENVSLSWLLGANSPPYLVARTVDEFDTCDRLRSLLEDEHDWRIVVLIGGDLPALLLHQPAIVDHPKGPIAYTAVELIAGPLGSGVLDVVAQLRGGLVQKVARLPEADLREIYAGNMGTYRLLGDHNRQGLVSIQGKGDVRLVDAIDNLTLHRLRVADGIAGDVPPALAPLTRWWPHLADAERDAITTLIDPLLSTAARRLQSRG